MPEKSRVAGPARRPGMASTVRRLLRLILVVVLLVGASQGTTLAAPASWDYVALGDSLATGFGAFTGYVPRYEAHIETDTGVAVTRTNLGRNGWTSSQLLSALRSDPTFRRATREAEIVTWNIGGNDLRAARNSYKKGTCGGRDNQDCLRASVATLKSNWTAITAEVLELRSTRPTIIRTMDIYNPYVRTDIVSDTWLNDCRMNDCRMNDFQVFKIYFDQANRHIATTSNTKGIPYAQVYLAFNGLYGDEDPKSKGYLSFDGLHPNNTGHRVIAGELQKLGYAPLYVPLLR
jgi:lysophospholipase L1-like esterase